MAAALGELNAFVHFDWKWRKGGGRGEDTSQGSYRSHAAPSELACRPDPGTRARARPQDDGGAQCELTDALPSRLPVGSSSERPAGDRRFLARQGLASLGAADGRRVIAGGEPSR